MSDSMNTMGRCVTNFTSPQEIPLFNKRQDEFRQFKFSPTKNKNNIQKNSMVTYNNN